MADHTKIEWTDATWNVITGCSVVSPGCTNCYAMKLAGTRLRNIPSRVGLTRASKAGPVWNGTIRFNDEWLDQPLRWRRPRMIFVCAHGDLFAEGVTDVMLDKVFAVMALAPQHTFQVLTKRPERMRAYLRDESTPGRIARVLIDRCLIDRAWPMPANDHWPVRSIGDIDEPDDATVGLPLPNVWLGVSVEDQTRADERIPVLLDTPAAVRWISAEPLLGPVDFRHIDLPGGHEEVFPLGLPEGREEDDGPLPRLDWIVAGGESGPGARPMHPDWVRSIRDQCGAAGVPFLFKQHGAWAPVDEPASEVQEDEELSNVGVMLDGQYMRRIGKKAAGRELDGVPHDGFPVARR